MSIGTGSYPYLGYFNLQQAPFTPVVDDAFFFADPAISQRLEMLRHLVRYSDLLLLVVGELGSGKTTLLQQFLLSSGEQTHLCRVDGEYGMDTGRLLERIAAGFGLPSEPRSTAELAESLGHIAGNQPFLLLIDDAHRLSMEALTALLELAEREAPGGRLVRIVLFCEPSINELLADPAIAPLRDRITQTMEMPLLTEEQTAAYLVHRMRVAGLRGESPFSAKLLPAGEVEFRRPVLRQRWFSCCCCRCGCCSAVVKKKKGWSSGRVGKSLCPSAPTMVMRQWWC